MFKYSFRVVRLLIVLNYTSELQEIQLPCEKGTVVCVTGLDKAPGTTIPLQPLHLAPHEGYLFQV